MISAGNRVIHYAGTSVALEFNDPAAEALLNRIVYPIPATTETDPSATIRIEIFHDPDPEYQLYLDGEKIYKSKNKIDFAENLLSKICYLLAFSSKEGLLFHAAGLGINQAGILVPGGIGFGKSTFTAWMVSMGCDYFSDEFVYFPWESDNMYSFYRPLHLRKPSRKVLSPIIDYDADEALIMAGNHSDLIHPTLIKADNCYRQPPLQLILFPHYQAKSELQWHELTAGETGLELMQFLINSRNLPEHGFGEIARLARKVKGIQFTYSAFEQIEVPVRALLKSFHD